MNIQGILQWIKNHLISFFRKLDKELEVMLQAMLPEPEDQLRKHFPHEQGCSCEKFYVLRRRELLYASHWSGAHWGSSYHLVCEKCKSSQKCIPNVTTKFIEA